jgi:hypothetical protein
MKAPRLRTAKIFGTGRCPRSAERRHGNWYWVAEEVELPRCIPQLVSAAKARLMLLLQVMRVQAMSRD